MTKLTVEAFLSHLEPFGNKETLSPMEASQLLLKIAELALDNTVDTNLLKFFSRFFTQQSYDELVEERNIEHQCGYLLCDSAPKHQVRRLSHLGGCMETATRYQIWNRKPSMILPNTYLSQYCRKEHYQASLFYRNQLSQEALFARKNILTIPPFPATFEPWYENLVTLLEEVLAKHKELKSQGKTLTDVISMMNGLSVADGERDTSDLVKMIEEFEIVENEGGLIGDEPDLSFNGTSAAKQMEGYIPTERAFGGYLV